MAFPSAATPKANNSSTVANPVVETTEATTSKAVPVPAHSRWNVAKIHPICDKKSPISKTPAPSTISPTPIETFSTPSKTAVTINNPSISILETNIDAQTEAISQEDIVKEQNSFSSEGYLPLRVRPLKERITDLTKLQPCGLSATEEGIRDAVSDIYTAVHIPTTPSQGRCLYQFGLNVVQPVAYGINNTFTNVTAETAQRSSLFRAVMKKIVREHGDIWSTIGEKVVDLREYFFAKKSLKNKTPSELLVSAFKTNENVNSIIGSCSPQAMLTQKQKTLAALIEKVNLPPADTIALDQFVKDLCLDKRIIVFNMVNEDNSSKVLDTLRLILQDPKNQFQPNARFETLLNKISQSENSAEAETILSQYTLDATKLPTEPHPKFDKKAQPSHQLILGAEALSTPPKAPISKLSASPITFRDRVTPIYNATKNTFNKAMYLSEKVFTVTNYVSTAIFGPDKIDSEGATVYEKGQTSVAKLLESSVGMGRYALSGLWSGAWTVGEYAWAMTDPSAPLNQLLASEWLRCPALVIGSIGILAANVVNPRIPTG
jgi:hypothetical protein